MLLKAAKRIFFAVFLISTFEINVPFSISAETARGEEEQFGFAIHLMERGDLDLALLEFERLVYLFPHGQRSQRARLLAGVCQLESGRYGKARDIFEEILALSTDSRISGRAFFFLAECYYRQGNLRDAEYYFNFVVENYSDSLLIQSALYRLGWTKMRENKWKEAFRMLLAVDGEGTLGDSAKEISALVLKGEELPLKDPSTAGMLAGAIPGMGHAYVGRYRDAAAAFIVNALFVWAAVEAFDQDHEVLGGILGFLELGWYAGNIYSAVNAAHKHNRKVQENFRKDFMDMLRLQPLFSKDGTCGIYLSIRY
jgi:outer membrane protein assembly factor BamD (BamD/ComL family)